MPEELEEIMPIRQMANGWSVLEIRGIRDIPGYDLEGFKGTMPDHIYRAEVLGDWTASSGTAIYPEFGDIHCARNPLPFDPTKPLVCGWDQGGTGSGTPAFVPTQLAANGQWYIYPPVCVKPGVSVGIYKFAEEVVEHLRNLFCDPYGLAIPGVDGVSYAEGKALHLVHYGDPAGNTPPPKVVAMSNPRAEMRSCYEIIRRGEQIVVGYDNRGEPIIKERPGFGWNILPGEVSFAKRSDAVRGRLTTVLNGGVPALVVDPGAVIIIDGFRGGYHRHERADGRIELDPYKDHFSDVMNALEYAASRLFYVRQTQTVTRRSKPFRRRGAGW